MHAYRSWIAAALILFSGPAFAANTLLDSASTEIRPSDCDVLTLTVRLYRNEGEPERVEFGYVHEIHCVGARVKYGHGVIPTGSLTGSVTRGFMTLTVNTATVPGFATEGVPFSGTVSFRRNDGWYAQDRTFHVLYEGPERRRTENVRTRVQQSATVTGVNNLAKFTRGAFDQARHVDIP
jgi:hypothetical protein